MSTTPSLSTTQHVGYDWKYSSRASLHAEVASLCARLSRMNAHTGQLVWASHSIFVYRSMYTSMSGSVLTSLGFYIAAHRGRCFDCWVNCQQSPTTRLCQTTPSLHILAGPRPDTPPSRYRPTHDLNGFTWSMQSSRPDVSVPSGRLVRVSARRFRFMSDNLLSRRARFSFHPDSSCDGDLSKTRQGMDWGGFMLRRWRLVD